MLMSKVNSQNNPGLMPGQTRVTSSSSVSGRSWSNILAESRHFSNVLMKKSKQWTTQTAKQVASDAVRQQSDTAQQRRNLVLYGTRRPLPGRQGLSDRHIFNPMGGQPKRGDKGAQPGRGSNLNGTPSQLGAQSKTAEQFNAPKVTAFAEELEAELPETTATTNDIDLNFETDPLLDIDLSAQGESDIEAQVRSRVGGGARVMEEQSDSSTELSGETLPDPVADTALEGQALEAIKVGDEEGSDGDERGEAQADSGLSLKEAEVTSDTPKQEASHAMTQQEELSQQESGESIWADGVPTAGGPEVPLNNEAVEAELPSQLEEPSAEESDAEISDSAPVVGDSNSVGASVTAGYDEQTGRAFSGQDDAVGHDDSGAQSFGEPLEQSAVDVVVSDPASKPNELSTTQLAPPVEHDLVNDSAFSVVQEEDPLDGEDPLGEEDRLGEEDSLNPADYDAAAQSAAASTAATVYRDDVDRAQRSVQSGSGRSSVRAAGEESDSEAGDLLRSEPFWDAGVPAAGVTNGAELSDGQSVQTGSPAGRLASPTLEIPGFSSGSIGSSSAELQDLSPASSESNTSSEIQAEHQTQSAAGGQSADEEAVSQASPSERPNLSHSTDDYASSGSSTGSMTSGASQDSNDISSADSSSGAVPGAASEGSNAIKPGNVAASSSIDSGSDSVAQPDSAPVDSANGADNASALDITTSAVNSNTSAASDHGGEASTDSSRVVPGSSALSDATSSSQATELDDAVIRTPAPSPLQPNVIIGTDDAAAIAEVAATQEWSSVDEVSVNKDSLRVNTSASIAKAEGAQLEMTPPEVLEDSQSMVTDAPSDGVESPSGVSTKVLRPNVQTSQSIDESSIDLSAQTDQVDDTQWSRLAQGEYARVVPASTPLDMNLLADGDIQVVAKNAQEALSSKRFMYNGLSLAMYMIRKQMREGSFNPSDEAVIQQTASTVGIGQNMATSVENTFVESNTEVSLVVEQGASMTAQQVVPNVLVDALERRVVDPLAAAANRQQLMEKHHDPNLAMDSVPESLDASAVHESDLAVNEGAAAQASYGGYLESSDSEMISDKSSEVDSLASEQVLERPLAQDQSQPAFDNSNASVPEQIAEFVDQRVDDAVGRARAAGSGSSRGAEDERMEAAFDGLVEGDEFDFQVAEDGQVFSDSVEEHANPNWQGSAVSSEEDEAGKANKLSDGMNVSETIGDVILETITSEGANRKNVYIDKHLLSTQMARLVSDVEVLYHQESLGDAGFNGDQAENGVAMKLKEGRFQNIGNATLKLRIVNDRLEVSFVCEQGEGVEFLAQNKDTLLRQLSERFDGNVSLVIKGPELNPQGDAGVVLNVELESEQGGDSLDDSEEIEREYQAESLQRVVRRDGTDQEL